MADNKEELAAIREILSDQLGLDDAELGPGKTLDGIGLDSLDATELRMALEERYQRPTLFDELDQKEEADIAGMTLAELAEYVQEHAAGSRDRGR